MDAGVTAFRYVLGHITVQAMLIVVVDNQLIIVYDKGDLFLLLTYPPIKYLL